MKATCFMQHMQKKYSGYIYFCLKDRGVGENISLVTVSLITINTKIIISLLFPEDGHIILKSMNTYIFFLEFLIQFSVTVVIKSRIHMPPKILTKQSDRVGISTHPSQKEDKKINKKMLPVLNSVVSLEVCVVSNTPAIIWQWTPKWASYIVPMQRMEPRP